VTVRDERAAALIRRHRDLSDDFTRALPGLLDDLEAIDAAHAEPSGWIKVDGELTEAEAALLADGIREQTREAAAVLLAPAAPTDAQIAAWIERNPKAFADWAAKQARTAVPAKPATQRRPAR
jgi:hypothetical protein